MTSRAVFSRCGARKNVSVPFADDDPAALAWTEMNSLPPARLAIRPALAELDERVVVAGVDDADAELALDHRAEPAHDAPRHPLVARPVPHRAVVLAAVPRVEHDRVEPPLRRVRDLHDVRHGGAPGPGAGAGSTAGIGRGSGGVGWCAGGAAGSRCGGLRLGGRGRGGARGGRRAAPAAPGGTGSGKRLCRAGRRRPRGGPGRFRAGGAAPRPRTTGGGRSAVGRPASRPAHDAPPPPPAPRPGAASETVSTRSSEPGSVAARTSTPPARRNSMTTRPSVAAIR